MNKLTAPGDLLVHFSVSELNADRKFDWSLTLEAADGGLVESNEEFMFLAPANGYQSTIEISQQADDPNWVSEQKRKFYITSRRGSVYGRLEMTIIPNYNQNAAIDLLYFINTNASRNLEYDPQQNDR